MKEYPTQLHNKMLKGIPTFGTLETGLYAKFCPVAINNRSEGPTEMSHQIWDLFPRQWCFLMDHIWLFIQAVHTVQTQLIQPAFMQINSVMWSAIVN